ncbi:MAG: flagellar biosynthetic protein FliR [Desulfovibrio sp.]|nr:flagellar biosynthetic protein FliR [Desulfovibrio sp.]
MDIFNYNPATMMSWLLTLLRVSIVMFMLPVFNTNNIPIPVKAAVTLVITLAIWPKLSLAGGGVAALHPFTLGLMVLGEVIMGLVLGLAINFLFMGIQAGGELLGFQMGFTMIQFADPLTGNQTGTAAFFLWMVSLLVFLLLDGHLYMIRGFAASFSLVPPGGLLITHTLLDQVLALAAQLFILALKIAAPVMVALFTVEVALALVARTSPQIHIMDLGMPVKISVGFFFIGLLLTILADHVANFIAGIPGLFTNLLRSMSPLFAN